MTPKIVHVDWRALEEVLVERGVERTDAKTDVWNLHYLSDHPELLEDERTWNFLRDFESKYGHHCVPYRRRH